MFVTVSLKADIGFFLSASVLGDIESDLAPSDEVVVWKEVFETHDRGGSDDGVVVLLRLQQPKQVLDASAGGWCLHVVDCLDLFH